MTLIAEGKSKVKSSGTCLSFGPTEFHNIHYQLWKNKETDKRLICVHGVTRNSKDFEFLSNQLENEINIACPDIPGRGNSDYLSNIADYNFENYAIDVSSLAAKLNWQDYYYLGTSMGGIVGMKMASKKNSPIKKLILNDIGPFIPQTLFLAVKTTVASNPKSFQNFEEAHKFFCKNSAGFGPMTEEQSLTFTKAATKELENGEVVFNYDPHIVDRWTKETIQDLDMWDKWNQIQCPVLVLRGKESPALTKDIADRMLEEGPDTTIVEIEDTGHAPHLLNKQQTSIIKDWLLE